LGHHARAELTWQIDNIIRRIKYPDSR
jgi:hypothetical protein